MLSTLALVHCESVAINLFPRSFDRSHPTGDYALGPLSWKCSRLPKVCLNYFIVQAQLASHLSYRFAAFGAIAHFFLSSPGNAATLSFAEFLAIRAFSTHFTRDHFAYTKFPLRR